jgi:hypothetical protein
MLFTWIPNTKLISVTLGSEVCISKENRICCVHPCREKCTSKLLLLCLFHEAVFPELPHIHTAHKRCRRDVRAFFQVYVEWEWFNGKVTCWTLSHKLEMSNIPVKFSADIPTVNLCFIKYADGVLLTWALPGFFQERRDQPAPGFFPRGCNGKFYVQIYV